ncbi:ribonuclease D [Acinetobacter baumannii]|uniref:Cro/CI family transcriptional regulator n=1 Tax=Acinetobacter baumannii TaxID=470 RepID=UPI000DE68FA6|nr:Cro/CI family transcriptional regulator [Acinetobacter baumannii]SSV06595.1 ribonuclease D [Acinetobacter baumannii]SSV58280.1 ribonuclease D [Acinetobacter baumannii]SSV63163.1 ribonuclease D [Acinetobacter baumannii]SSV68602.1 ribonuclease D [Acinetobacter baumannii]
MTKSEALALLNCSVTQLAEKLGISHNAVSQWDEKKIPLLREYQIRDMASKLKPAKRKKVRTAA